MSDKEILKKLEELIEIKKEIRELLIEQNELLNENNNYRKRLAEIRAKKEVDKELQAEDYRNSMYEQWKTNIAYEIKNNRINWVEKAKVFKFSDSVECKQWLESKLREDDLI